MKISFLGAARTVTGSMHLIEAGGDRVLLDCSLYQGRREESQRRNRELPFSAERLRATVLSHAHIDHSGNLPSLVRTGFGGDIFATPATVDLCGAMLIDSAKIQEYDAAYLNKKRRGRNVPRVEPLYDVRDARAALESLVGVGYHRPFAIAPGLHGTFYDAGHILGSAITILDMDENGRRVRLCFTGDLGRKHLPIIRDPEVVRGIDYLIIESTYGDRVHQGPQDARDALCQVVRRTYERGGKVIIPAFAVGRTQEIVYDLLTLSESGCLPNLPIYVDSPLAVNVTEIFRLHPECYDADLLALLEQRNDPFGFYRLHYTRSVEESKALNDLQEPCIIISASGMCEGGRILHHLIHHIGDGRNTIAFVGYQVENTLGRKIVDGWKKVQILGENWPVSAEVVMLEGYSAHAGRTELLDYVAKVNTDGKLKRVFVVHGEQAAAEALADGIKALGVDDVLVPYQGQEVEIRD